MKLCKVLSAHLEQHGKIFSLQTVKIKKDQLIEAYIYSKETDTLFNFLEKRGKSSKFTEHLVVIYLSFF